MEKRKLGFLVNLIVLLFIVSIFHGQEVRSESEETYSIDSFEDTRKLGVDSYSNSSEAIKSEAEEKFPKRVDDVVRSSRTNENSLEYSESSKISEDSDLIVVSSGQTSLGANWRFYSDGSLHIEGQTLLASDGLTLQQNWAPYTHEIKHVYFKEVKLQGSFRGFFNGYTYLETVDFGNADLSGITSMGQMFSNLTNLKSVQLNEISSSTSQTTDMTNMFSNCQSLAEIDLSNLDTSSVVSMSYMFSGCDSLVKLDLSNLDMKSVESMGGMFMHCRSLIKVNLATSNTRSLTHINYMFFACVNLEEVNLSGFDTSLVSNMASMFASCRSLVELDLSNFNTSSTNFMSNMFQNCESLITLNLVGFETGNGINRNDMFGNCSNLNVLTVGKKFVFETTMNLPPINSGEYWLDELKERLFADNTSMQNYHNQLGETNTYRRVSVVTLTKHAMGGKFTDTLSEITIQEKIVGGHWDKVVPVKENYYFDGWYLDKNYTQPFDFTQPANESLTIYAKWDEGYTVSIPALFSLTNDSKFKISGINRGDKELTVDINKVDTDISENNQLSLYHDSDERLRIMTQMRWEGSSENSVPLLIIPSSAGESEKEKMIMMDQPEMTQAGNYKGRIIFKIDYK